MRPFRSGDAMRCRSVMKLLQPYLDGQVDEVTAARIARHVEACRRCGLEARTYRRVKAALARREAGADPEALERLRAFCARLAAEGGAGEGGAFAG